MRLYTGELLRTDKLPIAIDLDSVKTVIIDTDIDNDGKHIYHIEILVGSQWIRVTDNIESKEEAKDEWRIWTNRIFCD